MARTRPPRPPSRHGLRRHAFRTDAPAAERSDDRRADRRERADGGHCLYGRHAVLAAIANPWREIREVLMTREAQARFGEAVALAIQARSTPIPGPQIVERPEIEALAGNGVHQGIAANVGPLPERDLGDVLSDVGQAAVIVVLDQVTDPHNVGAILRSADAFGATAVVITDRHAPEETGALAKAASGAVERMPLIRVVNLARELDYLKERGFWVLGLAGEATQTLAEIETAGRVALVLGAEGDGLRRLTRDHCDLLVRLPMAGAMPSLNVSNAAAVALYEVTRTRLR